MNYHSLFEPFELFEPMPMPRHMTMSKKISLKQISDIIRVQAPGIKERRLQKIRRYLLFVLKFKKAMDFNRF